MNKQYDKQLYDLCHQHPRNYSQMLKRPRFKHLWDYVLSCTQLLQDKEKETGHHYKTCTYVNWTLNHRTQFGQCHYCGNVMYEKELGLDQDYNLFCSIACMNKSPNHIKKVADTLEDRYGERIPTRIPSVMQKMQQTCLDLYGVDNCWKLPKIKEMHKTKESIERRLASLKAYNLEHYGVEWFVQSDEFKTRIKAQGGTSKEEKDLVVWLKTFVHEDDIVVGSFKVIPPRQLDVYIENRRIGIEFNGTYYHSIEHGIDVNYHLMKTKMCEDAGIKLIHIWEDEWVNDNERIKLFIKCMIDGTIDFKDHLLQREDGLFEVDRSKFNRCCIPDGYEIVEDTCPQLVKRSKSKKDQYTVPNCGKILLKKIQKIV